MRAALKESLRVSGKNIRYVRHKIFRNMPHKKFVDLVAKETGESISPKRLARFEAYGKRGAANPEKPTPAFWRFIVRCLEQGSTEEATIYQQDEPYTPEAIITNQAQVLDDVEEPPISRDLVMSKMIKDAINDYKDLGLEEAEGNTALEMIQSIKTKIRKAEKELIGTSKPESDALAEELKAIDAEERNIKLELEKINAELANLNGSSDAKTVEA